MRIEDQLTPHLEPQAVEAFMRNLIENSSYNDRETKLAKIGEYLGQQPQCEEHDNQLVHLVMSDGRKGWQYQCRQCYHRASKWIAKKDLTPEQMEQAPPRQEIDYSYLSQRRYTARSLMLELLEREDEYGFWVWYSKYLKSEKWQSIRRRVLFRDQYRCQACLEAKATQVHHKNYDFVGDEVLFDLVSVCDACHEKITKVRREKNGR